MHDLDLQQLAEAAMLQQAHDGDARSHSDAGQTRSNPRRSVNAGGSGTPGASVNTAMEDGSTGPARRTRQRSTRNTAAAATSTLPSTTSPNAPLASSSFARSPTGMNNGNNGNGKTFSSNTGGVPAGNSDLSSSAHLEDSLRLAALSHSSSSSARQLGTSSSTSETINPQSRPPPSSARTTRRKDRRNADQKTSISSINTVKSSLSATSATTSAPSLSHTATDPSISSAASDISSRTSEGTHATTPEDAASSLDAVHVLYAKGAQHPSYSNASIDIPPSHPYPVYHRPNIASIAGGKTGPAYHHTSSPQLHGQAISAGSGCHQAQHAYVNLQGRQFDPSQVQLYPHNGQDDSSQGQRSDLSLSNNEDSAGVRYFIDPYVLPSNHPYHPSQISSVHSTPHLSQQHGGLSYASTLSAPPPLHTSSSHQQQHYASALPPLPGTDYLLQFPNASQPHLQSSSTGYNGSGGGNGLHDGAGLNASTSSAANASTSTSTSVGDTVNEDTSMMSNNHKAEGGEEEEGEGSQEGADGIHPPQPSVPTKKQKGRRPTNTNLESKNHKCKFSNCNWSFSRREHLRRHEKTHTQEKPFLCDIPLCGLRFSRLDNLNSHKRTHDKGKRTSQWHVAKVVGAQQASRAGSGSVMDGSEDGRANAEASTSALQPAQSASQSGIDDSLPPHSAGGNGGIGEQNHYTMPGSSTLQRNGFPLLPSMDNSMNSGHGDNSGSTVGAEVRFAYYDPSEQQAQHSSGGHQHPQHNVAGLGGPYGNVRGYQDPFSYSAPPPPQHGVSIHSSAIAHSHLSPHPAQQQLQQHHHQMQPQQHSYNHQPLPPLPPHMHDESVYAPQHRSHRQQQQHHLSPHLQASGMVPQHEYDNRAYNTDQHGHQISQHHLMQHHEHQSQQQQQAVPPPPTAAVASNRNNGNNKRRRNESHRSNNSTNTINDNNNGNAMNTPVIQQPGNPMESPSHKRRQSGRKGGINT